MTKESGFDSRQRQGIVLFPQPPHQLAVHPISYTPDTRVVSFEVKWHRCEADLYLLPRKNDAATPHSSMSSWHGT
jgi:hypothetical protein